MISQFSQVSGYQINQSKSIIVSFNIVEQEKLSLLKLSQAKWQKDNMQCLGIKICRTNERMVQESIDSIIHYIRDKCPT